MRMRLTNSCDRTAITTYTALAAFYAFVLLWIFMTASIIVTNSSSRSSLRNMFVGSLAFSSSALSASSSSTIRRAAPAFAHSNKNTDDDKDNDDDATPALRVLEVCIPLPLGMILEELDAQDPSQGIGIHRIQPGSNAAIARATYTTATDTETETEDGPPQGCCVGDKILAVNGDPSCGTNFETMMARIRDSPYRQDPDITTTTTTPDPDTTAATVVTLTLQRNLDAVLVTWPNGISVTAAVGDYLGNVAQRASYHAEIAYDCRAGSCGVCAQWARTNTSPTPKLIRPCRATIPTGIAAIQILRKTP